MLNKSTMLGACAIGLAFLTTHGAASLPVVVVDRDDVSITQSCIVRIPPGTVIPDADGDGVIHINASGITVEFEAGSELRGKSLHETACDGWNTLTGTGIRVQSRSNVTLGNLSVHGYKVGVYGRAASGLVIEDSAFTDNYRHRLGSTPESEDGSDWLGPHNNDADEWMNNYGGAIYITQSTGVRINEVTVRRTQNGILLDQVNNSDIYDNDASFLSGWGLAMFRSSGNTITNNAFDFCVRGHSEGVYNRGQDSAGILMFEQCSNNLVANNSATHGGDGIFGFAGLDALLNVSAPRLGCNDNLFLDNDLSYAPAHGLEMTFSFGNVIANNRFHENAITGVWGGFSQDTLIVQNDFDGNGGMPYGEERGGINIEHGIGNIVLDNTFTNNAKGVFFWYDNPGSIPNEVWGVWNYGLLDANVIANNHFEINDDPRPFPGNESMRRDGVNLRNDAFGQKFTNLLVTGNTWDISGSLPRQWSIQGYVPYATSGSVPAYTVPTYTELGTNQPVGARASLRGRHNIVMHEWGPWDHDRLYTRDVSSGGVEMHEVYGGSSALSAVTKEGTPTVSLVAVPATSTKAAHHLLTIDDASGSGYLVQLEDTDGKRAIFGGGGASSGGGGPIATGPWNVRVWSWAGGPDPRDEYNAWYQLRNGPTGASATVNEIDFNYAYDGPPSFGMGSSSQIGGDHFAFEASAQVPLTAGEWRITTQSDDGVVVTVNRNPVINNFTYHPPTIDTGTFFVPQDATVNVYVLHFEIDGYAILQLDIEKVGDTLGTHCLACPTDTNLDTRVDFMDAGPLLTAVQNGSDEGDFTLDGTIDVDDVIEFVNALRGHDCR